MQSQTYMIRLENALGGTLLHKFRRTYRDDPWILVETQWATCIEDHVRILKKAKTDQSIIDEAINVYTNS